MPLMPIKCRICYRSIGAECDEDGNLFTDLCPDCEEAERLHDEQAAQEVR